MLKRAHNLPVLLGLLVVLGLTYGLGYAASEPFYNNDETRHVMTGVYFRDLLYDAPFDRLRDYTVSYYLQYPALGLLVWPPFFYVVEGLFMCVFGTSLAAAKALVALYAAASCAYLFLLVSRTHDARRAAVAVLFFGLSPLVFHLSHYVMLEVPTLAAGLAAIYHFTRFLDLGRRRDLWLAGLASALAALTRFDAVYLLAFFVVLLAARGRCGIVRRKDVWAAAAAAALLVLPFYALTTLGIGWFHLRNVAEPNTLNYPAFFSLERLFYYPSHLPEQLGLFALLPAAVGLFCACAAARRERAWPYLALVVATYVTFTPMAEVESRHAVYWVPAFALFAAEGVAAFARRFRTPKLYLPLSALLLAGVAWQALAAPRPFVRGYEEAARHVVSNPGTSPFCLFLGRLNGDFIYQVRRHDRERRLWVLRADKLLYSVLVNPGFGYKQFAEGDEDILATIFKYDPEFIVLEEAPPATQLPVETRLRAVVNGHPERFRLERDIAVETNDLAFAGTRLKVFKNLLRNDDPERRLSVEVLMLRRSVEADVP